MKTIKLARFPKIKHEEEPGPSCLPASIENVVRYHGGEISQQDIRQRCIDRHSNMDDIDLQAVRQVMDDSYGDDFSYRVKSKRNSDAISSEEDLLALAERGIVLDVPPIIQMDFPSCLYLPSYSRDTQQYVLTVLGASENHLLIWDTNPGVLSLPIVVSKEWMSDHMASSCTSLWIVPRDRENDVERLFSA